MKILITYPIDSSAIKELRKRNEVVCSFLPKKDLLCSLIVERTGHVFRNCANNNIDVMQNAPSVAGDLDVLKPLAVPRMQVVGLSTHDCR